MIQIKEDLRLWIHCMILIREVLRVWILLYHKSHQGCSPMILIRENLRLGLLLYHVIVDKGTLWLLVLI